MLKMYVVMKARAPQILTWIADGSVWLPQSVI